MKGCLKHEDINGSCCLSPIKKEVSFGPLTIDEFPIILGECCVPRDGAPIALGDRPFRRIVIELDRFENAVRPDRRRKFELLLDDDERASILLLAGYSIQTISDATLEAFQVRVERMESARDKHTSLSISKAFSTTSRALKNLMLRNPVRYQSAAQTA